MTSTPLLERLRAVGWRLTPQRRVIAEAMGGDHVHLTAEEVLERARGRLPEVSLATVYNTLNELVSMGEVQQVDVVVALPATTPTPRTVITTSCASNAVTYATCIRKDWTRSSCHARTASAIGSSTEKCSSRATAATAAGHRHRLLRQQATGPNNMALGGQAP